MRAFFVLLTSIAIGTSSAQIPSMQTADSLFKAQNWNSASIAYEKITKANPNPKVGLTFYRLGFSLYALGNYAKSIPAFSKAINISGNPQVMFSLSCAYNKIDKKDSSLLWLDAAATKGFNQYQTIVEEEALRNLKDNGKFKMVLQKIKVNAMPCLALPEYRSLDFWLGKWKVTDTKSGNPAGTSSIELILDECVIFENWYPITGFAGKSFSLYNLQEKKWKQTYVSADGTLAEYTGEQKNNSLVLTLKSTDNQMHRMVLYKDTENRVRQIGDQSSDNGKTWITEFDLTYSKN
ncbi:hypothetical protein BH10BAC4_BH10BAC4_09500 [soil metagenome]